MVYFRFCSFQTSVVQESHTYQPSRTSAKKSTKLPRAKLSIGKLLKLIPDSVWHGQMIEVIAKKRKKKTRMQQSEKSNKSKESRLSISFLFGHHNKIEEFYWSSHWSSRFWCPKIARLCWHVPNSSSCSLGANRQI